VTLRVVKPPPIHPAARCRGVGSHTFDTLVHSLSPFRRVLVGGVLALPLG
jgi:hypothetical protein